MNDKTLVERLKEAEHFYVGAVSPLFREAAERIEEQYKEIREIGEENIRLEAEVKELAEKRAINTAKQLNEIHGAVRKEMNDKTWIYTRDMGALYREAAAEIERLEAEAKDRKEIIERYDEKLEERDEEIERLKDNIGRSNSKFAEMAGKLKETNDKYNTAVEENSRLNQVVTEATHANDGLIKRNLALVTENSRLSVELNNTGRWEVKNDDLSVRDHIAIAAMNGVLSVRGWHPEYIIPAGAGHVGGQRAADTVAEQAYVYADAMLKVRKVEDTK
jgi:chromosome segregation ATPase